MSQWFKFGEFSAYPFEDGVEEPVGFIVDAAVVVRSPIRAALSRFNVSGATADIEVVNFANPSEIVATTANVVATFTTYGAYSVYTVEDPVTTCIVRIVVLGTAPIISFVGLAPFAAIVHDIVDVVSLNGLRGDVVIDLPAEMTAEQAGDGEVTITALSPAERGPAAAGCNPVLTIGGVRPTDNGSFSFVSDADNNHRFRVVDGVIEITNFGVPCCTCRDYYNLYNVLAQYDQEVAASLNTVVTDLIRRYHALVEKWWTFTMNKPIIDVTAFSSDSVSAGLTGSPVSRAVYGIMRMTTGSYSAAIVLAVTNAAWYTVSVRIAGGISPGVTGRGTVSSPAGSSDFSGNAFDRTVVLKPGETCELQYEKHDVTMRNASAVGTATVTMTPVSPGTPPRYLPPASGGSFSLSVKGQVLGSAPMINGAEL